MGLPSEHTDWVREYEQHERDFNAPPQRYERKDSAMSRSNPSDGIANPSTRWFEWAGGEDGGFITWYDKDAKQDVKVPLPFTFLVLDELATIKGWHKPSTSSIYANEIRDTRQEVLVVKSFKGGELASGLYASIKDRVKAVGGKYAASIYIAYREGEALRLGNLSLKGGAGSAWMDFKKAAGSKKDDSGKSMKAYFLDAVRIVSFEQATSGGTTYRVPVFALAPVTDATNKAALALDTELQAFLADYLKRPKGEAVKAPEAALAGGPGPTESERAPAMTGRAGTATAPDFEDDIPF
jgi:hypothetical protein